MALNDDGMCQYVLIIITIIILVIVSQNKNLKCGITSITEKLVPNYCNDPVWQNANKLLHNGSAAYDTEDCEDDGVVSTAIKTVSNVASTAVDTAGAVASTAVNTATTVASTAVETFVSAVGGITSNIREKFSGTMDDSYRFNDFSKHKLRETTSEYSVPLPKNPLWNSDCANVSDNTNELNQLLYTDKQPFQESDPENPVDNPEFKNIEKFCAKPLDERGDSRNCKVPIDALEKLLPIRNMENQGVRTYEHYTNRLKEPVNFNNYKPLMSHAGITDTDLIPRNYGLMTNGMLDRFKYSSPLSDMDPQYEMPYEYKKECFTDIKKNNYTDYLKEAYVDGKVKQNHKDFVKHLKEKNVNCNMASNFSQFSGDVDVCGSVLARNCGSDLGSCGGSSFGRQLTSADSYIKHKTFCSTLCSPVQDCKYTP